MDVPLRKPLPQVPPDYLQMRVTVRPQGSMRLYARRDLPLVEARMVASATVELREDASMVRDVAEAKKTAVASSSRRALELQDLSQRNIFVKKN